MAIFVAVPLKYNHMTETEKIMKMLRFIRMQKGYTLRDLGAITGISHGTLCCYEKGDRIPTLENVVKIARGLGKDLQLVPYKKPKV